MQVAHQRNASGRFVKGNTINSGRDRRDIQRQMKDALLNEVAPEELALIIRAQVDKALDGNLKSAIFVRDTLIGKPQALKETSASEKKLIEIVDMMRVEDE